MDYHPPQAALRHFRRQRLADMNDVPHAPQDPNLDLEIRLPSKRAMAPREPPDPVPNNMPQKLRKRHDPMKLIAGLNFSRHTPKLLTEALGAAHEYEAVAKDAEELPPERIGGDDPSRDSLERGRARLDVVSMLIQRRQWERYAAEDEVQSVHIFSDASPVTGEELQGMLIDALFYDGRYERLTLPGCSLAYGATHAAVAVIWGIVLIIGFQLDVLIFFRQGHFDCD